MFKDAFDKLKGNCLDKFFYPKSIAVVGASNDISKIGGYIFAQVRKLENIKAYPVNVKWNTIQDCRTYLNCQSINENVDLAVIAIPADYVIEALKDCVLAKIKNIIIISAGFKEIGYEGKLKEEEIKKLAQNNNINLIGPNCLGILNPQLNLNCSFAKDIPKSGGIALISQSGAVIDAIIDWSFKHEIGFSKIVSLGNMAGIDELQILEYLKDDTNTKAIVFYMETLEKGEEFAKVLKEVSKTKPVIIIKPGTSENAKKAIGSHTGSLAQDNILVETLIKENRGILVNSLNELYNIIIALKVKLPKNKNVLILTNAGGPGVIATDYITKTGFELYKLKDNEKASFNFLPKEASLNNPIDILGDATAKRYSLTLEKLMGNEQIGNILVLLTPQIMTDSLNIANVLTKIASDSDKTIFSCFLGEKEVKEGVDYLDKNNFANFQTPSEALTAVNTLFEYNNFDDNENYNDYNFDEIKIEKVKEMLSDKKGLLDIESTKQVMEVFAINLPEKTIIRKKEDIHQINITKDKNFVLKVDSKELIHKKDVGGVILGITSDNFKYKIHEMYEKMSKISSEFTLTLEEEIKGIETIIGLKSDKTLGNFIMFGTGGTYVSIFKDVNFNTCPLSRERVKKLVEKSKIYPLLCGYRGAKPIHFEHLYELLIRMSYVQKIFSKITEIDLNPVICNENGVYLVDVKLIIA